jgi:hypothetical protein
MRTSSSNARLLPVSPKRSMSDALGLADEVGRVNVGGVNGVLQVPALLVAGQGDRRVRGAAPPDFRGRCGPDKVLQGDQLTGRALVGASSRFAPCALNRVRSSHCSTLSSRRSCVR